MANNWPGSKHEEYGGYLKGLTTNPPPQDANDEWYGKSNPMASWQGYKPLQFGGYLDTLQADGDGDGDDDGPSSRDEDDNYR